MTAYFYTGLAILLWSTVATAFKLTLSEVSHLQLLLFASFFSMLSLFVIILIQKKVRLIAASPKLLLRSAILGLINPTFYYLILFLAYDLLPAQEAQPLNWTWPIVLSILSVPLLKHKLSMAQLIGIVVAFLGVFVITTKGAVTDIKFTDLTGDILAISSSLLWALFWIFNMRDERDPVVKLFLCFLFGNVYNVIIVFSLSEFDMPSWKGVVGSAYVGLFEMGITFVIWLKALDLAKNNASVSVMAYTTPFVSLLFIHTILGEAITASSIVGLSLIVSGIVLPFAYSRFTGAGAVPNSTS